MFASLIGFLRKVVPLAWKLKARGPAQRLVVFLGDLFWLDLVELGYQSEGVGVSWLVESSGEKNFIENILPTLLPEAQAPVFLDVGAHRGDYARLLAQRFPQAKLHVFEPQPGLLPYLAEAAPEAVIHSFALSNTTGETRLFVPYDDQNVRHAGRATLSSEVAEGEVGQGLRQTLETVASRQLDEVLDTLGNPSIDLLKVDVEGHELEVLQGARRCLAEGKIRAIQFELNECCLWNRRTLKDYYQMLPGFHFFRILPTGLFLLGPYQVKNELYLTQNILAVRDDLLAGNPELKRHTLRRSWS